MLDETRTRIESELQVKAYIQDLKFALNNGSKIEFQAKRFVDENRDEIYIKIRVELLGSYGNTTAFIISFHFAEKAFTPKMFLYNKIQGVFS